MSLQLKAKQIWRGLNSSEIDLVLWSCTTYPVGDEDTILSELRQAYADSDGDLMRALRQADLKHSAAIGG